MGDWVREVALACLTFVLLVLVVAWSTGLLPRLAEMAGRVLR